MSRFYAALSLALAVLAGCGASDGVDLEIGTARLGLLAQEVAVLRVVLHPGENSCEVIRLSGPRIQGAYSTEIQRDGAETEIAGELFDIVPGDYTAAAWAFDASSSPVAFGCQTEVVAIAKGERASIVIELNPR